MGEAYLPSRGEVATDFRRTRRQAALMDIFSRLTGKSAELLSYEDVRKQLRGRQSAERKLHDIALDAIVGSVGRYREFTRGFLPRKTISEDRWVRVKMAMIGLSGVPPIEVYRIGEAYFVLDGNHRVSVARQMGLKTIQAYVTEVKTRVSLTKDIDPDDLILRAEYAEFLEQTRHNELRPEADLSVTAPGQYPKLLEHIDVHRYFMGIEQQREIPYLEAVTHWYDTVYRPVIRLIREKGLLRYFPKRTETDFYLWLARHRTELEKELGWDISAEAAIAHLSSRFVPQKYNPVCERLKSVLTLDEQTELPLQQGRPQVFHREDHVFNDLLVSIDGEETGWVALEQAFRVAWRERARLRGLHVVSSQEQRDSEHVQAVRAEFERRCQTAGIAGKLAVDVGKPANQIYERARWNDLVVAKLTEPFLDPASARLDVGFRVLLRRSPQPVLVVPNVVSPLDRILLAYDGGPKAKQALYIATYLAGWWHVSLVVVTVSEEDREASDRGGFSAGMRRDRLRRDG
jgi:hypothetical protein